MYKQKQINKGGLQNLRERHANQEERKIEKNRQKERDEFIEKNLEHNVAGETIIVPSHPVFALMSLNANYV